MARHASLPRPASCPDAGAHRAALAAYPGPAVAVDAAGMTEGLNETGRQWLEAAARLPIDWLDDILAAPNGAGLVRVPGACGDSITELSVVPGGDGTAVLLGRDVTVEHNLRRALAESRARFKDLVEISSDFTWETDESGRFVYVSPHGALGWRAEELLGLDPAELVVGAGRSASLPFAARRPVEQAELWLKRADGGLACLQVAAVPLGGEDGWRGARGVCRDITELRARELELAAARRREQLCLFILRTLHEEADSQRMLDLAAGAIARGLDAQGCAIYRNETDAEIALLAQHGAMPAMDGAAIRAAAEPAEHDTGEGRTLLVATAYRHAANGALAVFRGPGRPEWTAEDQALFDQLARQLGVALEQMRSQRELQRLSETDALTGLCNRRGFHELSRRHLDQARQTGRPAALCFVDLDNFKSLNDACGHAQGDAALKAVARILKADSRPGDVIARLGGDEFALWLDDADEAGAAARARRLFERVVELRPLVPDGAKPLGFSIGIAVFATDSAEDVDGLVARADEAMYAVKRAGKGHFIVAAPAGGKERKP